MNTHVVMCIQNEREAKNKQKINKHTCGHVQKNQASCGKSRAYVQPCAVDLTSREISEAEAGCLVRSHLETVFKNRPNKEPCFCFRKFPCGQVNCTRLYIWLVSPPSKSGETDFQTCGGLTLAAAGCMNSNNGDPLNGIFFSMTRGIDSCLQLSAWAAIMKIP